MTRAVTNAVERSAEARAKKDLKAVIEQELKAGRNIEEILRDL